LHFNDKFWKGKRVLLTGHTGFKGAWLTAWLVRMGAKVYGFALPATGETHLHGLLSIQLAGETLGDIRDQTLVHRTIKEFAPEIVLHLAAQAIVRTSYADPIETFDVNVLGTAILLSAVRTAPSIRSVLIVTTDKVYENLEHGLPFSESDRLGGHDPYSASKACVELVSTSFRKSFFSEKYFPVIATARAGNVIGGGDWSTDRLVPDLVRAIASGKPVQLRYPFSVRPWLHVLEPLSGYLMMVQRALADTNFDHQTFNFAPNSSEAKTVAELVDAFTMANAGKPGWRQEDGEHPKEAELLTLSSSSAEATLGWKTQLSFEEVVKWTTDWYSAHACGEDMRSVTEQQIEKYMLLLGASENYRETKAMKANVV